LGLRPSAKRVPGRDLAGVPADTTATGVFSLGAILYEVFVGHPPFAEATVAATLQKVLTAEPWLVFEWHVVHGVGVDLWPKSKRHSRLGRTREGSTGYD